MLRRKLFSLWPFAALAPLAAQTMVDAQSQVRGSSQSMTLVDNEVPGGVINSTNTIFTLATAPNPVGSLHLYRNGLRQFSTLDFNLVGVTVTFTVVATPLTGDTLLADYRH